MTASVGFLLSAACDIKAKLVISVCSIPLHVWVKGDRPIVGEFSCENTGHRREGSRAAINGSLGQGYDVY